MQTHKPQTARHVTDNESPLKATEWWFVHAMGRMVRAYLKRRRDRRAYRDLLQLPDYLLKDMGLPRHKVHHRLMRIQSGHDREIERKRPARRHR
ncbi:MAG: DUF1127 domain-containing protein [Pseudomonadota bacterium]